MCYANGFSLVFQRKQNDGDPSREGGPRDRQHADRGEGQSETRRKLQLRGARKGQDNRRGTRAQR